MKPKYTATDLFHLRKPLKLLSIIDGYDDDFVDDIFKRMETNKNRSQNLYSLFNNFQDFFDQKLPGITINRLKIISKNYHLKIKWRSSLKNEIRNLHLKNRLLPLSQKYYEEFGKKSTKHFYATYYAFRCHRFGRNRKAYFFINPGKERS